jgi:hypothetical protein
MKNLKDFSDINFFVLPDDLKRIHGKLELGNYSISVVTDLSKERNFSYGTLGSQTFEVAVLDYKGDFVPLAVVGDILSWQSINQINHLMAKLQADDVEDWINDKRAEEQAYKKEMELDLQD